MAVARMHVHMHEFMSQDTISGQHIGCKFRDSISTTPWHVCPLYYCRSASVSERSEAINHCLFEPRRYIIRYLYRTTRAAHVTLSRDGSSFQGVLLLLFGRSSLPACSRGSGAQKESRWEWQRRGCVLHAEGATLQDGARDLIRRQRGKNRPD